MKATTLRPLLIVLLFGFLPTSGWMIVRGGADHTVTRAISNSCPMPGAGAHRRAAGPWPASPAASGTRPPGAVYAQPSARIAPRASHDPGSLAGAKAPELVASAYPDDGFGDFSVPGAFGAALDHAFPADPGHPSVGLLDPPGGIGTSRTGTSRTGTTGTGTSGGGTPGTGAPGTPTGGQTPTGSNGNHQLTVPEPSTLALLLAGTAALGFTRRRRRVGS